MGAPWLNLQKQPNFLVDVGISIGTLWRYWGLANHTIFQSGYKSKPAAIVLIFFLYV